MATIIRNLKRAFYSSKTLANYRKYASFDGVNDYIEFGNQVCNFGLSDFTISCRIRTTYTGSGSAFVVSKSIAQGVSARFGLSVNGGVCRVFLNIIYNQTYPQSGDVTLYGTKPVADGNWHSFIATFDRDGLLAIHIDGIADTSINIAAYKSGSMNSTFPFRIGAYTQADNTTPMLNFPGDIDSVRAWRRLLTQAEITALAQNDTVPQGSVEGFWELSGNANDSFGTKHGVPKNGVTFTQEQI